MINNKLINSEYARYSLLVISILFSLNYMFWSIYPDAFYWINLFKDYPTEISCPLTLFIGYAWTSVFGDSLLSVRMLAWCVCMLSMFIPYLVFIPRNKWIDNMHWLSLGIIAIGYGTANLFNPDTVTVLLLVITVVVVLKMESYTKIWLLGLITALAITARFPNIVSIFAVLLILIYDGIISKKRATQIIIQGGGYLLVTMACYYALITLFTGRLDLINAINEFLHTTGHVGSSHAPKTIVAIYIYKVLNTLPVFLSELFIYGLILWLSNRCISNRTVVLLLSALVLVCCMIPWMIDGINKWFIFLSYMTLALICNIAYQDIRKNEYRSSVILVFIVSLCATCFAGSDTGIKKMHPFIIMLLPIILSKLKFNKTQRINSYIVSLIVALGCLYMFLQHNFSATSICDISSRNSKFDKISAIFNTSKTNSFLDEFSNDLNTYVKGKPCVFYGIDYSHLMYYLTDIKPIYDYSFRMDRDNIEELRKIEIAIKKEKEVFFFDECGIMYEELISKMDVIRKTDYYTLYRYKSK